MFYICIPWDIPPSFWTVSKRRSTCSKKEALSTAAGPSLPYWNCKSLMSFTKLNRREFSSRMTFGEYNLSLMSYGRRFQRHRRMIHEYLTQKRCLTYLPVPIREARVLLQNILCNEVELQKLLQRWSLHFWSWSVILTFHGRFSESIIVRLAFGHQIPSNDESDPYARVIEDISLAINNSGPPGGTPVDLFPFRE